MPSRLISALWILSLIIGSSRLEAESAPSDWFFRAWQTEHGLPDNTVSDIVQSPDGYLWVATNAGAVRFNGNRFSPLPLRDIPELPSREVQAMFLDRLGRIWLALTRGPVIRIDRDSFHSFHHDDGIFDKRVVSMTDDPEGRLWIAYTEGVCRIEGDKVTLFGRAQAPPHGPYGSLACDANGQVWLAIGGRLGRLGDEGFELVRDYEGASVTIAAARESGIWLAVDSELSLLDSGNQPSKVASLPDASRVRAIFEDRNRAVWIGTQELGLLRVKGGSVESVVTSHASVSCISEDREGNIWAGTRGGGLNLVRPRAVKLIDSASGLPFSSVRSSTCDTSGRIWAVSQDGQLAYQESRQWHLDTRSGDAQTCVTADPDGRVWVGTSQRGLLRIDGSELVEFRMRHGLSSNSVRSLLAASNGDVWIATDRPDRLHRLRDDKITRIEQADSLRVIRAIAEGADGTVWIGTSDGRLLRVDGDSLVDESDIDGPHHLSIRTLHATPDGSIWIGYAGDGLGHIKNGRFRRITREEGLHDDYISQIQDAGDGLLWIAANRGLFQVSLADLLAVSADPEPSAKLRCRVFGRTDGVPSIQPSRNYAPTACRSPDDRLYFSTHSGIVEVKPDKIRENALPPPVVLEKVTLDNRTVALYKTRSMLGPDASTGRIDLSLADRRLELPPGHDKLVIDVAALSLASPENVHLRYRLKPIDENWEEVENRHSVTFPPLPAGKYEFQVIACNNVGVWNQDGATLSIVVHPFFWETWWFRIGGSVLTAFAAGGMVFLRLRRLHRRQLREIAAKRTLEQERTRIARDIHDDLGASLTRITLLSQSQPSPGDESSETLDQIHATARHLMRSMEEVVWAVNPEHDTFDALANYLSTYGQGFLRIAGVRCRLEMPLTLPERPLSAQIRHNLFLAYKEALNNAVKHAEASEVRISLQPGDDAFVLKVEDNGGGIDPKASAAPMRPTSGSGLANMKSRMDEIGGTCTLHSTLGEGATVEFQVPFRITS